MLDITMADFIEMSSTYAGVGGKRQNQGTEAKQGPSSDQTKDSIDHMLVL